MTEEELERALEAILFVSDEPLTSALLAQAVETDRRTTEKALDALSGSLEARESGMVLRNIAGGWQLFTHPDTKSVVERFVLASRHTRMTKASLETLAIVAYKQPVTRHQIAAIRGVNSDGVLKSLMDRDVIAEVGHEDVPGRPLLYGTTPGFLERLGLPSLAALPSLAPLLDAVEGEDEEPAAEGPDPILDDSILPVETGQTEDDVLGAGEDDEAGEMGTLGSPGSADEGSG